MKCLNRFCMNTAFGNRLRCGRCRRYNIYQCSECGKDLENPRKTKCDKCLKMIGRWKKYYIPHPVVKNSVKISKLLKSTNYLSVKEICDRLGMTNGIVRTTIYLMRKEGKEILNVKNKYVLRQGL